MTAPSAPQRVGVLLAQLGTPAAPTAQALRPYLRQFLSDRRVIDLPLWKWLPILHLIVLRVRPKRSAALYQRIWTDEGSPLMVISRQQVEGVQQRLGDGYRVIVGMRYGQPGIEAAFRTFAEEGIDRVVVLPMFPQFSCSTTGSIYDAVTQAAFGRRCPLFFDRRRRMPAVRFVPPYYDHPGYIDSLKVTVEETVAAMEAPPDRLLFTFHGLPLRYVTEGDPYRDHCEATTHALVRAMDLPEDRWLLTFQSRFGSEVWLQPYTDETLEALPGQGVKRLLAACPGFTADCLETLDEIGNEGGHAFREAGGQELRLAPCVNAHPRWLDAMADMVRTESAGWVTPESR